MKFILISIATVFAFSAEAQPADTNTWLLKVAESELAQLQVPTFHSRNEKERIEGNKQFIAAWDRIASLPQVMDYRFTSLKDVSILDSKDKKIRIVTWNLFKNDGTHIYFGYLFTRNPVNKKRRKKGESDDYHYHKLSDRSMLINDPARHVGGPQKWFGMLYTQIIDCGDFYTLIGWDGNDRMTQRKFVDVLWFRRDDVPVFGKDAFSVPKKVPKRLMFEYAGEVSMSLRYSDKERQIIYSHLAPREEGGIMEGQYQYYGPDGSFDALELKRDKWRTLRWMTVEDVDARNEKSANDNVPKPDPRRQKPVYKPK